MATKKCFFWLKKISFLPLLLFIIQCESMKRSSVPNANPEQGYEDFDGDRPRLANNSFVGKEAPKLGLILGGGGVLSYAHIGVLRELTKQKIPVQALVGIEWGALVAATYGLKGRAHEVEWQLLKMPHNKFSQKGMFSASSSPVSVREFDGFIKGIFGTRFMKEAKVSFACPYVDLKTTKSNMASSGRFANVIKKCWPYPPQFQIERQVANPLAIREAVQFLKNQGAEFILYIDVVNKNLLLTSNQRSKTPSANLMWLQNQTLSRQLLGMGIHEVLSLPLSGAHLTSYESMRLMIRMGQMKSRPQIKKLSKKYGY